ncbi:MAG: relaxase domain-containing protein [Candidatus Competibacteraceae bacterium]|nr:relaxase domain-containing protein [Candidatus Competibacteraceae bacterium]
MLSLKGLGAAGEGAGGYYLKLTRDDYYTQGGEPSGQWVGQGTAGLGLAGTVDETAFRNVLHGFDGTGARPLVQGAGADHYAGWDLTFSAPKSVSVVWALTDDPQVRAEIQAAQQAAVTATLRFVEAHCAYTRRGHDGVAHEKVASLAVATFEHSTSREQDPQLHTHCLVANVAQRDDGTYGALDGRPLFRWTRALGAIYRAELAAQLETRLPLQIERDGSSFAIQGVPKAVQERFSKRSEQIKDWMAERGYEGAKAAQVATLDTRSTKAEIDRPALFTRWREEGAAAGWGPEQATTLLESRPAEYEREAAPALAALRDGLVEKQSTFTERDAWRAMAEGMQGVGGLRDIETRMNEFWRDSQLVTLKDNDHGFGRWSTESLRRLEAQAVAAALMGAAQDRQVLSPAQVESALQARTTLSAEQTQAVRYLCEQSGAVALVEGMAGTGKSFMLDTARAAWEGAGYQVIGAALSGQAALGLQESAHIPSATLHARLQDWAQPGALDRKTVVVVDEAGMVDSRKMAALIEATQTAGAKLVLVGDHRQLQPIEAGGIFRALTERIETANLSEIRRQVEPWARDAVHALAEGRAGEALKAYDDHGLLHVSKSKTETIQSLVSAWTQAGEHHPGDSRLMLAGERADVRALNVQAREGLQQSGHLGPGQKIATAHGVREFSVGDRLVCTRNSTPYGVKNGQLGTLEAITPQKKGPLLRVRLDEGHRVVTLPTGRYDHLDHGYALTTHKAQGVTVDRVFVLAGGNMANREIGLVQLSRHRQTAQVFVDRGYYAEQRLEHVPDRRELTPPTPPTLQAETSPQTPPDPPAPTALRDHATRVREAMEGLARQLQASHQKDTTQDYPPAPQPSRGQGLE